MIARLGRGVPEPAAVGLAALVAMAVCAAAIGENPLGLLRALVLGALGDTEGLAVTLYYATDFIFAGLAVAVAYRAGLFNIGVEGQSLVAGVGLALAALASGGAPSWLAILVASLAAMVFGAAWALVPGWLLARRGGHVVITTIMFNFIASALLSWLLVDPMRAQGSMQPETRPFPPGASLLRLDDALVVLGLSPTGSPLNASLALALAAMVAAHVFLFRSRLGFETRVFGASPTAAHYAGVASTRVILIAMGLSGALASGVAINELLGAQNRLILDFSGGAGFVGIAVALLAGNRPLAIAPAALLFGFLYQGGAALGLDYPRVSPQIVTAAQGVMVLLIGGLLGRRR